MNSRDTEAPVAWTVLDNDFCLTRTKGVADIWQNAGLKITPLYASPTVRGDREAIARVVLAALHQARDIESETDFQKRSNLRAVVADMAADKILSLPVQPTRLDKGRLYAVLSKSLPQSVIDEIWQDVNEAGVFVQPGAGEREPTPEMRIAGGIAWAEAAKTAETYVDCADACWKAMWDVRPLPEREAADIEGFVSGPYKYEKDSHACFRVVHPDERRLVACVYATDGEERAEADAELFARALRQAPHSSSEME